MDARRLLEHLRVVQQARELQGAMRAFCDEEANKRAAAAAAEAACDVREWAAACCDDGSRLRHCDAEVAGLVLKDMEASELFPSASGAAAEGVLACIRDKVFGDEEPPLRLMQHVYSHSCAKARLAREACLAAVRSLVAPRTCFSLLRLADVVSLPSLHAHATRTALADWTTAVAADVAGFAALSFTQLLFLLSQDSLQAGVELAVFASAVTWVTAAAAERVQHLPHLLAAGVRLELMDRDALAEVDAHPLVAQDRACSGLVAKAYLARCYGPLMGWTAPEQRPRMQPPGCDTPCQPSVASCASRTGSGKAGPGRRVSGACCESSEQAQSCARTSRGPKRARDCSLSPSSQPTPALRRRQTTFAVAPPLPAGKPARLPSKRRLFD